MRHTLAMHKICCTSLHPSQMHRHDLLGNRYFPSNIEAAQGEHDVVDQLAYGPAGFSTPTKVFRVLQEVKRSLEKQLLCMSNFRWLKGDGRRIRSVGVVIFATCARL